MRVQPRCDSTRGIHYDKGFILTAAKLNFKKWEVVKFSAA